MTASITCPLCGMRSYHPEDVKHRYCGNCNAFHVDMNDGPVALEHLRDIITRAAQRWEERNAGAPENPMLREFAERYGLSYDWLMGRQPTR